MQKLIGGVLVVGALLAVGFVAGQALQSSPRAGALG